MLPPIFCYASKNKITDILALIITPCFLILKYIDINRTQFYYMDIRMRMASENEIEWKASSRLQYELLLAVCIFEIIESILALFIAFVKRIDKNK